MVRKLPLIIKVCQWFLMISCSSLGVLLFRSVPKSAVTLLGVSLLICPLCKWNTNPLGALTTALIGLVILMVIPL